MTLDLSTVVLKSYLSELQTLAGALEGGGAAEGREQSVFSQCAPNNLYWQDRRRRTFHLQMLLNSGPKPRPSNLLVSQAPSVAASV